jgi:hypothetical protein
MESTEGNERPGMQIKRMEGKEIGRKEKLGKKAEGNERTETNEESGR